MDTVQRLVKQANTAKKVIAVANTTAKNDALKFMAEHIIDDKEAILAANMIDLNNAKKSGLSNALIDRLMLNDAKLNSMVVSLRQIINLPDIIGNITDLQYQPSGIQVGKMRVAIGVICMIYESRPNVTIDAAALCIKSGNAVILRGGKEAINSNTALHKCITSSLKRAQINQHAVQFITDTNKDLVTALITNPMIDLVIPRGGKKLVKVIDDNTKVPVMKHLDGICHTYIDKDADNNKAINIAFNAKTRSYGVCNATETLLIHKDFNKEAITRLINKYLSKGVELRGCTQISKFNTKIKTATTEDWRTEYLSAILSIKIVDSMTAAIEHINTYGSHHTESIVTQNYGRAREFIFRVDSSSVMINASTGFADGFEYGLGAEIGISTDKLHARGPVGLLGLTSEKYIVLGDGHIRK